MLDYFLQQMKNSSQSIVPKNFEMIFWQTPRELAEQRNIAHEKVVGSIAGLRRLRGQQRRTRFPRDMGPAAYVHKTLGARNAAGVTKAGVEFFFFFFLPSDVSYGSIGGVGGGGCFDPFAFISCLYYPVCAICYFTLFCLLVCWVKILRWWRLRDLLLMFSRFFLQSLELRR